MKHMAFVVALAATLALGTTGTLAQRSAADDSLTRPMGGNRRFVAGQAQHPRQDGATRMAAAKGQSPFAMLVSCADSRVPPEILFDQGIGDLFVVRAAGNIADTVALGSLEYGYAVLGAPLVVVLGHEYCGAVDAAVKGHEVPGHIAEVVRQIKPAVEKSKGAIDMLNTAIDYNVRDVTAGLAERSGLLRDAVASRKLKIVGARYDMDSGQVTLVAPRPAAATQQ